MAAHKARELGMEELLSQIAVARKETEEIAKSNQLAEQAWNADRDNFLSLLGRYEKRIEDMSMQNEMVSLQYRAEKIVLESKYNESKARTQELLQKIKDERHLWDSEKGNLESSVVELQTKLDSMASENVFLSQKNRELSTEADYLNAQFNDYNAALAHLEYERDQNERLLHQCRAEKIDVPSELSESKGKTQDLVRKFEEDRCLWDAEKSNLEGIVAKLQTKLELMASESGLMTQKNTKLSTEAESSKVQLNVLESELNESKGKIHELLKKNEEDRHLWDNENKILEGTLAALQTNLHLVASERELLSQKNTKLSTEAMSLKAQLKDYNAKVVHLECEREKNERLLHQCRTEKIDLQSEFEEFKGRTKDLVRKIEEDRCLWGVEKSNLEDVVAKLQTKLDLMASECGLMTQKNTKLSTEAESSKAQLNVLESELNESKGKIHELLRKNEEDRHLWDKEKKIMEGTLAALQTNLKLMASERGLLNQKNTKLNSEAKSLKTQLNDCNARLSHLECEREKNERLLHQCRTEKIDLQSEINESKGKTQDLARRIEEDRCLCCVEKSNLEGVVAKLQKKFDLMASENGLMTQKSTKPTTEAEPSKARLNALKSELNESKGKTQELLKKFEEDQYLWEGTLAALQTNHELMASERGLLSQKNRELSTEAKSLKAQLNDYNATLAHLEYEREKDERLLHQCRTEKIDLQSQLNESKGRAQDLVGKIEDDRSLWGIEKSNLEGIVTKLQKELDLLASENRSMTQKNTKISTEAESLKSQLNALESQLNESKKKTQELLKKLEDGRHLWDEENKILEGTVAELQTNLELMACERGLMNQKNRELSTEEKSLKAQLNDYNARLFHLASEREKNERLLHQCRTEKINLQSELNESKGRTGDLVRQIEEDRCLWVAEKSDLEGVVVKLQQKLDLIVSESGLMFQKNIMLSTESKSLKSQLNALESKLNESKGKTQELQTKVEDDQHLWDEEKKILEGTLAELQTNLELMASERELLSQKNRELSTEEKSLKVQLNDCNARLSHLECEREKNERLLLQCRREKTDLQSKLNESTVKTQDLVRKFEEDHRLWVAEKINLEGIVANLQRNLDLVASERGLMTQKNTKLSTEAESLNSQLNALESKLNESKRETQELLKKLEDDRHLWDKEKMKLEGTLAEQQTHLELMASERGSMGEKNMELSNEVEFLKTQVSEYNTTLVYMQGERQVLKDLFASNEGRLEVLLTTTATMENEIKNLQQQVNDGVKQHSELTQQYKVREHSLKQQNEMLQEEVVSIRCLLETQNQRVEELIVENGRLNKQVEELSKRIIHLQATHIKQVQEKEEERMAFESLHAEVAKKYRQVEEKHFELLKENEEQGKMIESLKGENASLGSENIFLLQSLKEETKRSEEISKKCLKNDQRVLDLESQSLGLHTELTATKFKCDGVTTQLNKLNEDMKKISNDSCQIQEEKGSLHEKLELEISRNKALEEQLMSMKSSLEEMKESASKGEQQIAKLHSEILAVAKEKEGQIIDIQNPLLAMVEEKESQLTGLQDQLSSLAAAKILFDEENNSLQTELDKRTLVSKEEQAILMGRFRELETALDTLSKDLESSRAIAQEKEGKIVELQYQLSYIADAKMCLEEKHNSSLLTDLNKYRTVSEENVRLQNRIRELETALYSPNKDLESKDVRLQKLKEHKPLQGKSLALENGKPNAVHEKPKPNGGLEKQTQKPVAEKQAPPKPVPEKRTAKQVPEKQKKIWL